MNNPDDQELDNVREEQLENLEEEVSSPEETEGEFSLDTLGKQATITASKKVIDMLMKRKVIVIATLVAIGVIAIIIILGGIIATTDASKFIYKESTCKNVTITYDPYGEGESSQTTMELEDYVSSAVYAYTKDLKQVPTSMYHVYYSLAIALRNEALTNDCKVTYRDKKLEATIPKDDTRDFALKNARGITVVDKKENFVPVKVSDFCWSSLEEETYSIYQAQGLKIPTAFTNLYLDNEVYRDCECNKDTGIDVVEEDDGDKCYTYWPNEVDEETGEVQSYNREYLHQDDEVGYNLYGALDLLVEHGRLYDEQLRYFLGQDIYYRTTIKEDNRKVETPKCTGESLPYNSTPLSRQEFIDLVTEFLSNDNLADYKEYFINYAGQIYDMGIEKNINPELIYIFARKETGFTSISSDTDHYNYYGMGHCNSCANGTFYESFMEGVEAQFDYFVNTGSLSKLVSKYSSLGSTLYNFNPKKEMGLGGCYYMRIIYGESYSRCDSSYHCEPIYDSNGNVIGRSPDCKDTTEEERQAYLDWQAEKYIEHRLAIFKLGSEICEAGEIDTEATLEIPENQLTTSLREFLASKGTSVDALNQAIFDNVEKAGVGTRAGVAAAATTLINYMNTFDLRLTYTFGGGHGSGRPSVEKPVTSYYGVDPDWGTPIGEYYRDGNGPYLHYGPDCSAFVTWVLHNGGIKISLDTSTDMKDWGTNHKMDGNYIAQVGDVVVYPGHHVRIIVGVNKEEKYYITAESNGLDGGWKPYTKGISYQKMNFVDNHYLIVDMSEYYQNDSQKYSKTEFAERYHNSALA